MDIGIVGCGYAGGAAALFLARAGHRVTVYEAVDNPGPVGAGIVLQPTGMFVCAQLGLLDRVIDAGARIDRLHAVRSDGRTVVDLNYRRIEPTAFGLGLHRGALFEALFEAVQAEDIDLRLGHDIRALGDEGRLLDIERAPFGPHELIVVADGARSPLRGDTGIPHSATPYPWGALWFVAEDPDRIYDGELFQVVDGTSVLLGFLPTGVGPTSASRTPLVSIFWGLASAKLAAWRDDGIEAFKDRIRGYDPRSAPLLDQIESEEQVLYSGYFDVRMRRHHHEQVVLIGDAAHATSPQLGQGCNLALWDAMVLAQSLEGSGTLQSKLQTYGTRRRAHLAYYQLITRWLTPFFQSDHAWLGTLRDAVFPLMSRLPPFEGIMVRTMSGTKRGLIRPSMPMPELPRQLGEGSGLQGDP